jgi:hypothetical protein
MWVCSDVVIWWPSTEKKKLKNVVQKTLNTRTQYMSANITLSPQEKFLSAQHVHVDMAIANTILKKGTRVSFQLWGKDDHDLTVTIIQKTHVLCGFGLTPNIITQTSDKVTMESLCNKYTRP